MALKERTCRYCKARFVPPARHPGVRVCSEGCGIALAEKMRAKIERANASAARAETRQALERIKPRAQWMKEAQTAVNRYVRLRDRDKGCVSCDRPATWGGQWHASHFRSVGAASAVRFNLWNIHKACAQCNLHKSGNIAAYTPRLIAKMGQERVDWLYSQNQTVKRDIDYYKKFKRVMGERLRRLQARALREQQEAAV